MFLISILQLIFSLVSAKRSFASVYNFKNDQDKIFLYTSNVKLLFRALHNFLFRQNRRIMLQSFFQKAFIIREDTRIDKMLFVRFFY